MQQLLKQTAAKLSRNQHIAAVASDYEKAVALCVCKLRSELIREYCHEERETGRLICRSMMISDWNSSLRRIHPDV